MPTTLPGSVDRVKFRIVAAGVWGRLAGIDEAMGRCASRKESPATPMAPDSR